MYLGRCLRAERRNGTEPLSRHQPGLPVFSPGTAVYLSSLSDRSPTAFAHSRRLAIDNVDAHGEVKVNCWEKPTQISEWKEEHIVIAVLAAWGVTITSAMKIFGGGDSAADVTATESNK
jgi:hypothetical protein